MPEISLGSGRFLRFWGAQLENHHHSELSGRRHHIWHGIRCSLAVPLATQISTLACWAQKVRLLAWSRTKDMNDSEVFDHVCCDKGLKELKKGNSILRDS